MCEGNPNDLNGSEPVLSEPSLRKRNTRQAMAFCRVLAGVTMAGFNRMGTEGREMTMVAMVFAVTAML